jgi:hypothetical protein
VFSLILIDFLFNGAEGHVRDLFDSSPNMGDGLFGHELLEIPEGELVSVLELSVVLAVFLDGVICQVDEVIIDITCGECFS